MASVEQVRGQIGLAKEQADRGAQALQEAETQIGQAQQAFQEAAHYLKSALHDIDVKSL